VAQIVTSKMNQATARARKKAFEALCSEGELNIQRGTLHEDSLSAWREKWRSQPKENVRKLFFALHCSFIPIRANLFALKTIHYGLD
jgi:hypothetical protein